MIHISVSWVELQWCRYWLLACSAQSQYLNLGFLLLTRPFGANCLDIWIKIQQLSSFGWRSEQLLNYHKQEPWAQNPKRYEIKPKNCYSRKLHLTNIESRLSILTTSIFLNIFRMLAICQYHRLCQICSCILARTDYLLWIRKWLDMWAGNARR